MAARRITRTQLVSYLNRLSREAPLPEPKLYQAAKQFGLDIDQLLSTATRIHVRYDEVKFVGVNQTLLEEFRQITEVQHEVARVDQALIGNSHGARVSGAMVTIRSAIHPHPEVVIANDNGEITLPPKRALGSRLVIVENLENFLSLEGTLDLLPTCGLHFEWRKADILYGSGNTVTNHLLSPFFQEYREIGCLFDPDPGGIRMCDTLYQRGNLPPLHFLAPADLSQRLEASSLNLNKKQREQLSIHMRRSPPCTYVGSLIRATGKHLEQETYLVPL